MTTPTIRAALERLIELQRLIELRDADNDWGLHWDDAIDAAHAALAEPVGEGPSDEELLKTYCDTRRSFYFEAAEGESDHEDRKAATIAGLRAILARWGRPATPPAPEAGEVSDALIKAECALSDISEGEDTNAAPNTFEWAEQRCAETLAAIRPVMKQHRIRTSEWPPQPLPQAEEGEV
jgi:hypothetical protein